MFISAITIVVVNLIDSLMSNSFYKEKNQTTFSATSKLKADELDEEYFYLVSL